MSVNSLVNLFRLALKHSARFAPPPKGGGRKQGKQRLKPALDGGNWQGVSYLTYAEHDRATMWAIKNQDSYDWYVNMVIRPGRGP